jgi:hypothetical protein
MEENGRRRDLKNGKDLERSWSLGQQEDLVAMLRGSILKE